MDGGRWKRGGGRPLADWVEGCIAPALARFGFAEVDLVSGWADIVGPRVAALAEPVALKRPRRSATAKGASPGGDGPGAAATLVVRVEGAFALELQHLAPLLIERINAHLGWRCVGKLALQQAPLRARPEGPRPVPPPTGAALAAARTLTASIDDEALRAALVRLGGRTLRPR